MFFYCYDFSCLSRCCNNCCFIQWFDCVHVDYFCTDSVCCKLLCCCEGFRYFQTCCDDCHICTFTKCNGFTNLEFVICVIIDNRNCKSSETEIYRSYMLISCFYSCFCFYIIGRIDYDHSRDCSHKSDIFVTLMCSSIFSDRDSGMCSTDLNI